MALNMGPWNPHCNLAKEYVRDSDSSLHQAVALVFWNIPFDMLDAVVALESHVIRLHLLRPDDWVPSIGRHDSSAAVNATD